MAALWNNAYGFLTCDENDPPPDFISPHRSDTCAKVGALLFPRLWQENTVLLATTCVRTELLYRIAVSGWRGVEEVTATAATDVQVRVASDYPYLYQLM
jgi:hypothetical protein